MMRQLLLVALGGSLGAVARYAVTGWARSLDMPAFFATFAVNTVGSALMGIVYVVIVERGLVHPEWRHIMAVGLLGAFTTFSTFSLEAMLLIGEGRAGVAGLYVLASVVLCIAGCAIGAMLTRLVLVGV